MTITDHYKRTCYSAATHDVRDITMGRRGHILKFPIAWIAIKEEGKSAKYFGAVSAKDLTAGKVEDLNRALKKAKRGSTREKR